MHSNTFSDWIKSHRIILLLGSILILAIFLRFYNLGTESIWLDEVESIRESSLTIQGISASSNQPPLYFLLLRGWIDLFGTSETAIRSLSAILGVVSVFLMFLVGRSLFNSRTGLIGAFLSALAFFAINYSQDARAYSLLLCLSLFSYWLFIKIIKQDKIWFYPIYFLSCLLLAYTHLYGLFIIASQVIFFLIFFRKYAAQRWKYFGTLGIVIISLIPFVLLLKNNISRIASSGFWITRPGFRDFIGTFANFSGFGSTRLALVVIFILLAALGVFTFVQVKQYQSSSLRKKPRQNTVWKMQLDSSERYSLLLLWLLIPILIPFIESLIMTPIYQVKYAIGAFPALCLLVANGLNDLRWQWVFYPVLSLIVILSAVGLHQYYTFDVKEQWREVSELVSSQEQSNDVVLFSEEYYQRPFDYYYRGNITRYGFNSLEEAKSLATTSKISTGLETKRVWLVLAYNKQSILNYFLDSYGEDSVKVAKQYTGITVVLFDLSK